MDARNPLGSWNTRVITVAQGGDFPALLTFDAGGGILADEPGTFGETTGHGNWMMTDERNVALTFVSLYSDGTDYTGKLKVVAALTYDASTQTWSGDFKIDIFDPDDAVVAVTQAHSRSRASKSNHWIDVSSMLAPSPSNLRYVLLEVDVMAGVEFI